MFKKKKKNSSLLNETGFDRTLVYDFLLRLTPTDYESYRSIDYSLYRKLEESEMLPRLDEHLNKLFAGDVDSGNADMLDEIIIGAVREAIPDLNRQWHDHKDLLERYIVRRTADREDLRPIREARAKELAAMQEEYKKICKAYEKAEEVSYE